MKFPGRRKSKHYFPVDQRDRFPIEHDFFSQQGSVSVVGIDQVMVDIDIFAEESFLTKMQLKKGESVVIDDKFADAIVAEAKEKKTIRGVYPGGTIGNTLHNFSVLADNASFLLGSINDSIQVGDEGFLYVSKTSSKVDLSFLTAKTGKLGRALSFITPDGERSFAVSAGVMNDLSPEDIPAGLIEQSSALILSAYHLRNSQTPLYQAALKAVELATLSGTPVVLTMGTAGLVEAMGDSLRSFVKEFVDVVAMNADEAKALTSMADPLLAGERVLDWCSLALITLGQEGLTLCATTDEQFARKTKEPLHSKSISNYNEFEYSRAMLRRHCSNPIKIYSHINPFLGGPARISNTNGAGDAALAALLHDIAANCYHRELIPTSPKHDIQCLSYSSLSQISKYANRVSYEVLKQNSPRLYRALPDRSSDLEEHYWEK